MSPPECNLAVLIPESGITLPDHLNRLLCYSPGGKCHLKIAVGTTPMKLKVLKFPEIGKIKVILAASGDVNHGRKVLVKVKE
jgi:hypothetical protein